MLKKEESLKVVCKARNAISLEVGIHARERVGNHLKFTAFSIWPESRAPTSNKYECRGLTSSININGAFNHLFKLRVPFVLN